MSLYLYFDQFLIMILLSRGVYKYNLYRLVWVMLYHLFITHRGIYTALGQGRGIRSASLIYFFISIILKLLMLIIDKVNSRFRIELPTTKHVLFMKRLSLPRHIYLKCRGHNDIFPTLENSSAPYFYSAN
jgi:hypothetical protein